MRIRVSAAIAAILLLAACKGESVRPIAPPTASVQKLAIGADGALALDFRVQHFGKKAAHFASLDARIRFDGVDAGAIHAPIGFDIPPLSSEVVHAALAAPAAAASAKLDSKREVRYSIEGEIATDKPEAKYRFKYESALSPVPGVPNEYR